MAEAVECAEAALAPEPVLESSSSSSRGWVLQRRPGLRLTSEYDSDRATFFHKVSCKLLDGFAKLKLTFQNDSSGAVSFPQLGFLTNNLSALYDLDSKNTLVKGSFDVCKRIRVRASRDIKEGQGEVAMIASLADPSYKLEISSSLPITGLPRAAVHFPFGEVVLDKKGSEPTDALFVNAVLRSQVMNGILTAFTRSDEMCARYSYKDEEMTFIPCVTLPSSVSFAFKRRFSPLDKLSYWYHFSSNDWNIVYKRNVGEDLKFKAGYDSEVRLAWASLWVGNENGKTKAAPMKTKVQFMLQVPQDDFTNSVFLFRVKKRWDL